MSLAVLSGIIGALCFSVGEGLRLTPFPVSTLTQTHAANIIDDRAPENTSLTKYGPLDVPAQTQKRNKRQVVDFACAAAAATYQVVLAPAFLSGYKSVDVRSVLFIARPSGRAPPVLS